MMNFVNGYKAGNKKERYKLELRLGTFTVLEIKVCLCSPCNLKNCSRFRFMILNIGFEC